MKKIFFRSNGGFEQLQLSEATTATYNFFLYELCDNYLEIIKPRFKGNTFFYANFSFIFLRMEPCVPFPYSELQSSGSSHAVSSTKRRITPRLNSKQSCAAICADESCI